MICIFPKKVLNEIKAVCAEGKEEHCGMLLGEKNPDGFIVDDFLPLPNAITTMASFTISPEVMIDAMAQAGERKIIGIYHNHPCGAHPSWIDLKGMLTLPALIWLIIGIDGMGVFKINTQKDSSHPP